MSNASWISQFNPFSCSPYQWKTPSKGGGGGEPARMIGWESPSVWIEMRFLFRYQTLTRLSVPIDIEILFHTVKCIILYLLILQSSKNQFCKLANLLSKLNFYKLIPYPMDNCFTRRRDRSCQTPEKDVQYRIPAGPVTECAFARWCIVLPSCLDSVTSWHLFRCLNTLRPLVS